MTAAENFRLNDEQPERGQCYCHMSMNSEHMGHMARPCHFCEAEVMADLYELGQEADEQEALQSQLDYLATEQDALQAHLNHLTDEQKELQAHLETMESAWAQLERKAS